MPGVPECQHDHYLRLLTFDPRLPSFLFKLETMTQFTIDKIIAILETTSDAHTNWIRFYQLDFKFSLGNQINTQSDIRNIIILLSVFSFVHCSSAPVTSEN